MSQQRNQRGNQKISSDSKNGNTTFQNLWDSAKAIVRGKFIVTQAYLKRQEKSQVSHLTLHHLKELEKEQSPKLAEGWK